MHLDSDSIAAGKYSYFVAKLDMSAGNAPVSQVHIADDFSSWTVDRVQ